MITRQCLSSFILFPFLIRRNIMTTTTTTMLPEQPKPDTVIPFTRNLKYTPSRSFGGDSDRWKAPLERFLSPSILQELYEKRKAIGGEAILPIFCGETQNDHVEHGKSGGSRAHIGLMLRVQRHTQSTIEKNDRLRGDYGRICIQAQSKYAMHHNGDHGDNATRKKVCDATIRTFLECCEADILLNFLDEVKAKGYETDDLADAFSIFVKKGCKWFGERTKEIYGGSKRVDKAGVGAELAKQLEGQSICIAAFDFGTRNFALCVGEIVGFDVAQRETYVTCENEIKTHLVERPHFRVLRWVLLDLIGNEIRADYRGPSPVYRRLDDDVNVTASAFFPKRSRKRRRSHLEEQVEETNDIIQPQKKQCRRRQKQPHDDDGETTTLLIDLCDEGDD